MAYLLAANPGTAGYAFLTIANANLLMAHGERDRVGYVKAMAEGRCFGTMCLSEPQAGSSLADIRTRAVPGRDGRYRLFGNKMWISGGDHEIAENIVHLVLAKIPDENGQLPPGVQGISLFTVPRKLINADGLPGERNDVVLAGINHKMGYRGTVNCLLNFGEGRYRPEGEAGAIGKSSAAGKGLAYMFHDERGAYLGRPQRRRDRLYRLPSLAGLCEDAPAGPDTRRPIALVGTGPHHSSCRCPAHAARAKGLCIRCTRAVSVCVPTERRYAFARRRQRSRRSARPA